VLVVRTRVGDFAASTTTRGSLPCPASPARFHQGFSHPIMVRNWLKVTALKTSAGAQSFHKLERRRDFRSKILMAGAAGLSGLQLGLGGFDAARTFRLRSSAPGSSLIARLPRRSSCLEPCETGLSCDTGSSGLGGAEWQAVVGCRKIRMTVRLPHQEALYGSVPGGAKEVRHATCTVETLFAPSDSPCPTCRSSRRQLRF